MAKSKRGITRDNIFGFNLSGNKAVAHKQGIQSKELPMHQTAVWLGDDDEQWLDEKCSEIKKGGWRSITRSAFIRALIQAAKQQGADLDGVTGEADLITKLASK